jgi:hypothetical protein
MPKPLRVAGEVDSWCTRCRLILNHRIVSIDRAKPHQVECLTCRTQHLWRPKAPGEPGAVAGERGRAASGPSQRGASQHGRSGIAARHEREWEQAVVGRGVMEFKAYDVRTTFAQGDLIRHKKFGDGAVIRIIDGKKVEVLFRDETRTLAQGMS